MAPAVSSRSSTVTSLQLQSDNYRNTSFYQLKQMFPAVISLHIRSLKVNNVVVLWQIIRLWPDLEEIRLEGQTGDLWHKLESEFCGTSREEVEYLWRQDEDLRPDFQEPKAGHFFSSINRRFFDNIRP